MPDPIHVISLGAGVQSSTMALMAAHGEITPMPEAAIFADTGWEPKSVYAWLEWLTANLPFPVYIVSVGNLRDDYIKQAMGSRCASIPFFTKSGMKPRQCTSEYKIRPIIRKCRQLIGIFGKRSPKIPILTQWIGISADEAQRMKPSREAWVTNRFPLIELQMRRQDCLQWMAGKGYPMPSRSACIGCPYHSDDFWIQLKTDSPDEFAQAISDDAMIRTAAQARGFREEAFMHRSLRPLGEVEFRASEPDRQIEIAFGNECEGMCGV